MKLSTLLSACLFWIAFSLLFSMCKKENPNSSPINWSTTNLPPIANAGADIALNRTSCAASYIQLNGSNSSDPEHDNLRYEWTKISGPSCSLTDTNYKNADINIFQAGQYSFGLKVTDSRGLSSKDTVVVNVTGWPQPKEVNLDVSSNAYYSFSVDKPTSNSVYFQTLLCKIFGISPCPPPQLKTRTSFVAVFDLATIGQFSLNIGETADTSLASNNHETTISLSNATESWLSGDCSVNFKQVILQGGGSFNGTCRINYGSAQGCDQNIFTNLSPLTISGTLDTTSHSVNLTIKGKTYF